jgi:hypothetical protein
MEAFGYYRVTGLYPLEISAAKAGAIELSSVAFFWLLNFRGN